jgi:hypothetical protein
VPGIFGSRRCDNTNRRGLQSRLYGRAQAETESLVHRDLSGFAVRYFCLKSLEFVAHFAIRGLIDYGGDQFWQMAKANRNARNVAAWSLLSHSERGAYRSFKPARSARRLIAIDQGGGKRLPSRQRL